MEVKVMRKCCVVCDYLMEKNKAQITDTAEKCGFNVEFYITGEEAEGHLSDAEVVDCIDSTLLGQMSGMK